MTDLVQWAVRRADEEPTKGQLVMAAIANLSQGIAQNLGEVVEEREPGKCIPSIRRSGVSRLP